MKMTTQNFRRTADTSGAGANVANAWLRFGDSLAAGISGIGSAYTNAKESARANALATRQLDIAQQQADAATTRAKVSSALEQAQIGLYNAQSANLRANTDKTNRLVALMEKFAAQGANAAPVAQVAQPAPVVAAAPAAPVAPALNAAPVVEPTSASVPTDTNVTAAPVMPTAPTAAGTLTAADVTATPATTAPVMPTAPTSSNITSGQRKRVFNATTGQYDFL